jgi:hypothetical protein
LCLDHDKLQRLRRTTSPMDSSPKLSPRAWVLRCCASRRCVTASISIQSRWRVGVQRDSQPEAAPKGGAKQMYVQSVSWRKVSKIDKELCGPAVSFTQVSACAAKFDVQFKLWRDRPLGVALPHFLHNVREGAAMAACSGIAAARRQSCQPGLGRLPVPPLGSACRGRRKHLLHLHLARPRIGASRLKARALFYAPIAPSSSLGWWPVSCRAWPSMHCQQRTNPGGVSVTLTGA